MRGGRWHVACYLKETTELKGVQMENFIWRIVASLPGKRGQTMTEYALILGLVAVAAVATYGLLGTKIINVVTAITTAL
jgi:Flp pilus assembly pilin Flp